ncbi:MAG: uroporphyrinogen-III C-methyltransferase [Bradymonadia bacterium]
MSRPANIAPVQGGGSLLLAWRLKGRTALVVGGGEVAAGRVVRALEADARVVLVAPRINAELTRRVQAGEIEWRERKWCFCDLYGAAMVMTAIDDPVVSRQIAELCRNRGIPVNVADVPPLCDFWFASMYRDGPVQIAISTNGKGPAIGSRLAQELGSMLPAGLGQLVEHFGTLRKAVRKVDPEPSSGPRRMSWLGRLARTWPYEALGRLQVEPLIKEYRRGGEPPEPPKGRRPERDAPVAHFAGADDLPVISLVGAGPGDPGLLTVAGAEALAQADLVVADRLIAPEILDLVTGELRIARKLPGRADEAQRELEDWVLEGARAGRHVVRLKAGDPFVFGRGTEEIERFTAEGFGVRVVPGISSALAGPLLGGMPPTARGVADRVQVLTAQLKGGGWPEMPAYDAGCTQVILMGVGRAAEISRRLIAAGHPADRPVAFVERASQPGQRTTLTTLEQMGEAVQRHGIRAPAVIVIGDVVQFATRFDNRADGQVDRASESRFERPLQAAGGT